MSELPTIQPAPPLGVSEGHFLAGEGTIAASMAGSGIRWVYCECEAIRSEKWRKHLDEHPDHAPYAIERVQEWGTDPMLFLDDPRHRPDDPGCPCWDCHLNAEAEDATWD